MNTIGYLLLCVTLFFRSNSAVSEEIFSTVPEGRHFGALIGDEGKRIPIVLDKDSNGIHFTLNHSRCVTGTLTQNSTKLLCDSGLEIPAYLRSSKTTAIEGTLSIPNSRGHLRHYQLALTMPAPPISPEATIVADANIAPDSTIEAGATIGSKSHIADRVTIGTNTIIAPHVVIESGSSIGNNSRIGSSSTVRKDCTIYNNAIIGSDVEIAEHSNVASHVTIGDGAYLGSRVAVGTHSIIDDGIFVVEGTSLPSCTVLKEKDNTVTMEFRTDLSLQNDCLEDMSKQLLFLKGKTATISAMEEQKKETREQLQSGSLNDADVSALTRLYTNGCFRKGRHSLSDCLK